MVSAFTITILLLSYLSIFFFGHRVGTYGTAAILLSNFSLCLMVLIIGWLNLDLFSSSIMWTWIAVGFESSINFAIRCDEYTLGMYAVVLVVSALVHIYSTVYMYTDPFLARFLSYLTLFTLFMLVLVSANNFIVLFLGWEGVGVCSYLLISFWYTRFQAAKAATKAFIINKIGDVFLLSGISIGFSLFGSVDFSSIFSVLDYIEAESYSFLVLCLFIGVVGKSAQIGLHTWLPDAMEGPTPVSALIHAATMVTAGVFLMVRTSPIFEQVPGFLYIAATWGVFTALFSGIIGLAQNDVKKIIAYSTCSQLGYMVLGCGLSQYNLAFFHLFNHAFFKACLFLSAGSIIHILVGEQDTRKMGGLASKTPLVYSAVTVASLSLMGVTFLSGFYSKDAIIEVALINLGFNSQLLFWLAILSALLTAAYSLKLLYAVFIGGFSGFKWAIRANQSPTNVEVAVLLILSVGGVFSGFMFKDVFFGFGAAFMDFIGASLPSLAVVELELINPVIKAVPLIGSFMISAIFIQLNRRLTAIDGSLKPVLEGLRFYYNEISNRYLALPTLTLARHAFENWEKGLLEAYGPAIILSSTSRLIYKI